MPSMAEAPSKSLPMPELRGQFVPVSSIFKTAAYPLSPSKPAVSSPLSRRRAAPTRQGSSIAASPPASGMGRTEPARRKSA